MILFKLATDTIKEAVINKTNEVVDGQKDRLAIEAEQVIARQRLELIQDFGLLVGEAEKIAERQRIELIADLDRISARCIRGAIISAGILAAGIIFHGVIFLLRH